MRVLVYTLPAPLVVEVNGREIVFPVGHVLVTRANYRDAARRGLSPADAEAETERRLRPDAVGPVWIEESALPADRLFRDALAIRSGAVEIDAEAARALAHDMRRRDRADRLAPLDEIIAKAIPGHDLKAVEAERAAIRAANADVQKSIDAASDPASLRAALGLPEFEPPAEEGAASEMPVEVAEPAAVPAEQPPDEFTVEAVIARRRARAVQDDADRPVALQRASEARAQIARKIDAEIASAARKAALLAAHRDAGEQ